jgi:hypothetical protein
MENIYFRSFDKMNKLNLNLNIKEQIFMHFILNKIYI